MENIKSVTLRVPEPIHRKLRMLAAMRQQTMTEALIQLIEEAKIENVEEIATIKSFINSGFDSKPESEIKIKQKGEISNEMKETIIKRKKNPKIKI